MVTTGRDLLARKGALAALLLIVTIGVGSFASMAAIYRDLDSARNRYDLEQRGERAGQPDRHRVDHRLAHTYAVTLPLDGRIARIVLNPGDEVTAGQELVAFDRLPHGERAAEARAMVAELEAAIALNEFNEIERTVLREVKTAIEAGRETLNASRAQVEARKAHLDRANKRLERKAKLKEESAVPQSELDDAPLAADTSLIDLRSEGAVIVPRPSVLQAPDGSYHVFEVAGGRLVKRVVEVGLRSDLELEITSGLESSATIVGAPDATLREGEEVVDS